MESKENVAIVPITSLNRTWQEYVWLTNQLDIANKHVFELRSKRKRMQPLLCSDLLQEQDRKRQFTIPTEVQPQFGNSCVGLCLYKRKRTKEFNTRSFVSAMVDGCVPLFKKAFKGDTPDAVIQQFAERLADVVWNTRAVTTTLEITALRPTSKRPKKDDVPVKKRKPTSSDANPAPTSMLKTQSDDSEEDATLVNDPNEDF